MAGVVLCPPHPLKYWAMLLWKCAHCTVHTWDEWKLVDLWMKCNFYSMSLALGLVSLRQQCNDWCLSMCYAVCLCHHPTDLSNGMCECATQRPIHFINYIYFACLIDSSMARAVTTMMCCGAIALNHRSRYGTETDRVTSGHDCVRTIV